MSENSIVKFIFSNNKWQNIEYDFSGKANNCTLNVFAEDAVIYRYFCLIINLIMFVLD